MSVEQIVIMADHADKNAGDLPEIGPRARLLDDLAACNTAPAQPGEDILHGPGFQIELAPGQDPVTQMLLTITEDDIAWVVLMRLARKFHWKLVDPMSGRELHPS